MQSRLANDLAAGLIQPGTSEECLSPLRSNNRLVRWTFLLTVGVLIVLLVVPFWQTKIPPVVDYPNHLAGDYILAHLAHSAWLSRIYQPHWAVIPDLASDLILLPLLSVLPTFIAGKLVLFMSLLAPLMGALLYNYALFGRLSFWPLASTIVAFNFAFLLGLANFLFGLGAAFVVAAIWIVWHDRHPGRNAAALVIGSLVVFFCHITAMFFLAVLLASYEIGQIRRFTVAGVLKRILPLVVTAIPTGLLYVVSSTASGGWEASWDSPMEKLVYAFSPVMNYSLPLDCLTGVVLIAATILAVRMKWLELPRCTFIGLTVLLVSFVIAPFRIKDGLFFDLRFITMAGYLMFGGMRENPSIPAKHLRVAAACVAVVVCGRIFVVYDVWQSQPQQVALVQQVARLVPPGSRVLIATEFPDNSNPYWQASPAVRRIDSIFVDNYHLPTIFLAQRQAFCQTLFADPTQQPIVVRQAYRDARVESAAWGPPDAALLTIQSLRLDQRERYPYLPGWQSKFDYVLVMNAGTMRHPDRFIPDRLQLLAGNDLAALYRVRPPAVAAPDNEDAEPAVKP